MRVFTSERCIINWKKTNTLQTTSIRWPYPASSVDPAMDVGSGIGLQKTKSGQTRTTTSSSVKFRTYDLEGGLHLADPNGHVENCAGDASVPVPCASPQQFDPAAFFSNYMKSFRSGSSGGRGGADASGNLDQYLLSTRLEKLIQELTENWNIGNRPASKSAIDSLVKVTMDFEDGTSCAVCKEGFEISGKEVRQMPCKHMYHEQCICDWLEDNNICPYCRDDLPTDEEFDLLYKSLTDEGKKKPVLEGDRVDMRTGMTVPLERRAHGDNSGSGGSSITLRSLLEE